MKLEKVEQLEPIEDRVLIKPAPPEDMKRGFAISEKEQEKRYEGTVIAVGPGLPLHNIHLNISGEATEEVLERIEILIHLIKEGQKMHVKPGDYVLYGKYAGTSFKVQDQEYIMLRHADIFSIIKKD